MQPAKPKVRQSHEQRYFFGLGLNSTRTGLKKPREKRTRDAYSERRALDQGRACIKPLSARKILIYRLSGSCVNNEVCSSSFPFTAFFRRAYLRIRLLQSRRARLTLARKIEKLCIMRDAGGEKFDKSLSILCSADIIICRIEKDGIWNGKLRMMSAFE